MFKSYATFHFYMLIVNQSVTDELVIVPCHSLDRPPYIESAINSQSKASRGILRILISNHPEPVLLCCVRIRVNHFIKSSLHEPVYGHNLRRRALNRLFPYLNDKCSYRWITASTPQVKFIVVQQVERGEA